MGCKWWGKIVGWYKGWFVSLVNRQVTMYYKEDKARYRISCVDLEHKGCKEKCLKLEETYNIHIIPESNGERF